MDSDQDSILRESSTNNSSLRTAAQRALESNIAHQYALTKYAEKIAAELEEVEDLMAALDTEDGALDDDLEPSVQIPKAQRATGPCPPSEFLNPLSPFYDDASRRSKYLSSITTHTMKAKEIEVLTDAVRRENERLRALKAQACGQSPTAFEFDIENNTVGLDWDMVAEKVSGSATKRTAEECRIKWIGDRHPTINHGEWLTGELDRLKDLVGARLDRDNIDWVSVAKELGTNRTPIDCMRHGLPRKRHMWNPHYDQELIKAVELHGVDNWAVVARFVSEDATAGQCQGRYFRALDPTLKKGNWTEEEDARLAAAAEAYGNAWVEVAATLPGRTNEHCRERWQEKFSSNTKASAARKRWTDEEDAALVQVVKELGKKWKEVSTKLGKTAVSCRQRYDKLIDMDHPDNTNTGSPNQATPEVEPALLRSNSNRKATIPISGSESSAPPAPTKPRPKPRPKIKISVKGKEKEQGGIGEHSIGPSPVDPLVPEGTGAIVTKNEPAVSSARAGTPSGSHSGEEPRDKIESCGGNKTTPDTAITLTRSSLSMDAHDVAVTPTEVQVSTTPVPRRRGRPPKRPTSSTLSINASISLESEGAVSTSRTRGKQAASAPQSKAAIRPNERKRRVEQVVDAPSGDEIPSKRRKPTRGEPDTRENLTHDGERADHHDPRIDMPAPATRSSPANMEAPSLIDVSLIEATDQHFDMTPSLEKLPAAISKRKRGRPRNGTMLSPAKCPEAETPLRRSTRVSTKGTGTSKDVIENM
ncbi:hypothetical protein BD779DRAFT_1667314 [Infundibulicybe gibba]|nr:hypothetical protein BD779DRAFT_1667314 [Infundibulicybe gibba]